MLRRQICLSRISACLFFAYFKFRSDWGRVTGKIKEIELDCRHTAPLSYFFFSFTDTYKQHKLENTKLLKIISLFFVVV